MIVLKNHFNGNDTLVHKGYVMNGCQFFSAEDYKPIQERYNAPQKAWDQVLAAMEDYTDNLHGLKCHDMIEFAFRYCKEISNDPDLRQVIIDNKSVHFAYRYCKEISNDFDMRQIIIDNKNSRYACFYCKEISNDFDMRQVIIDNKDPHYAWSYCHAIAPEPRIKQVIIDAKDATYAYYYCRDIAPDPDMQQIITPKKVWDEFSSEWV